MKTITVQRDGRPATQQDMGGEMFIWSRRCAKVLKYIRDASGGDRIIAEFWRQVAESRIPFSLTCTMNDEGPRFDCIVAGRGSACARWPSAAVALAFSMHPEEQVEISEDASFVAATDSCIEMPASVAEELGLSVR